MLLVLKNHRFEINKHPLSINSTTNYFALFTIITCATFAFVLILLFALFVYKRKEYLATKLVKNVRIGGSRDDAESLVTEDDKKPKKSWCLCIPFLNRKSNPESASLEKEPIPNQDYQVYKFVQHQIKNTIIYGLKPSKSK